MKYEGVCIAVKDIKLAKKFYQDIFGLQVLTDYGINISFGALSLQQEFDWLLDIPKDTIIDNLIIWSFILKKKILTILLKR